MKKCCGNCTSFTRMKQMQDNSGICEYHDCRTDVDCGKDCPVWKGIKYKRSKEKIML